MDKVLGSLLDQIAAVGGRASELTAGLARTVSGAIGGLLGGRAEEPSPVGDPLIPPDAPAPATPPPTVPIPVGKSYVAGGSFSGESVSSGGKSEKLMQQFAVLDVLSQGSAPRPPNERPG